MTYEKKIDWNEVDRRERQAAGNSRVAKSCLHKGDKCVEGVLIKCLRCGKTVGLVSAHS